MKKPKQIKRLCKHCKTHTDHKIAVNKTRGRNQSSPLSRGSKKRVRARGERRGAGNKGRYSKPTKPKLTGKKLSKKTDFRYTCSKCRKTSVQSSGIRAKKVELI